MARSLLFFVYRKKKEVISVEDVLDGFTSNLFGAVHMNSGLFSCLVQFIWAGVNAAGPRSPEKVVCLWCESRADRPQDFVAVNV